MRRGWLLLAAAMVVALCVGASAWAIAVPNNSGALVATGVVLDPSHTYRIVARGTISDWCPDSAARKEDCSYGSPLAKAQGVDALYCYATWKCATPVLWRQLVINGQGLDQFAGLTGKIAYSSSHAYTVTVSGKSGPVTLGALDAINGSASDNSGAFDVQIVDLGTTPAAPGGSGPGPCKGGPCAKLALSYTKAARFEVDRRGDGPDFDDPATVSPRRIGVRVTIARCNAGATYAWTVDGRDADVDATPGSCDFGIGFPREGVYAVAVREGDRAEGQLRVTVQDFLIAGLGDSLASGEGAPDVEGNTNRVHWQLRRCDRSNRSWQSLAAQAAEQADAKSSVTFVHLACSGAGIVHGLLRGYEGVNASFPQLPGQVGELGRLARGREIDAVLLSIGVNEFKFGELAEFCVKWPTCQTSTGFQGSKLELSEWVAAKVKQLPALYAGVATALRQLGVEPGRVYVVQYPDFLSKTRSPRSFCDEILDDAVKVPGVDIGVREAEWLYENLLVKLNAAIATAAARHTWKLIPAIQQGFEGHGYCASDSARWTRTYSDSMRTQGDAFGSLHPNRQGHVFIAGRAIRTGTADLFPDGKARTPRL